MGTGGALPPDEEFFLPLDSEPSKIRPSTFGALLSFVEAFFKLVPFLISPNNASVFGNAPLAGRLGVEDEF